MILILEFGGLAILYVEASSPEANITSASDAVWYVYVTITTVGYGDQYPVSATGRILGALIMTVGVGLFGTITAFLANIFVAPENNNEDGAEKPGTDLSALASQIEEMKALLMSYQETNRDLNAKLKDLELILRTHNQ
jgi:voltage-gated potassium channel